MPETLTRQLQDRIDQLVARFSRIAAERMRDLPVYNPVLSVEAIDFQPHGGGCVGVLITPWFMNLVLLSSEKREAVAASGQKFPRELPSGTHDFMLGEDEELGCYEFLSLASPMFAFDSQASVRQAAHVGLQRFLTPKESAHRSTVAEQPVHFAAEAPVDLRRRAFLFGRRQA